MTPLDRLWTCPKCKGQSPYDQPVEKMGEAMTPLDRLAAIVAAMTPGEWEFIREPHCYVRRPHPLGGMDVIAKCYFESDIAGIVALRNAAEELVAVVNAARQHVQYAKAKEDCAPCLECCPNAKDGDLDCECGASAMTFAIAALEAKL